MSTPHGELEGSGADPHISRLYSGPGRQLVEETGEIINGSPLVAWAASKLHPAAFAEVLISDRDEYASACKTRLSRVSAPVEIAANDAADAASVAAQRVIEGLHLVFADPYNLKDLPWQVFEPLIYLKHIDFIVHFSQQDLTRNLDLYIAQDPSPLDTFAPGWRRQVPMAGAVQMRGQVLRVLGQSL